MSDVSYVGSARHALDERSPQFMPASSKSAPSPALTEYFADLDDPRREGSTDYPLHEIVVLTICAVICGADGFTSIAGFGQAKKDWFRQFLELEHGIPSHDTIGRFFGLLDPEAFEACFSRWVSAVCEHVDGEVIAVDGKTIRRSYDRASNQAALHMVSAWASENGLALGQVKTADKSNEITAIPELLEVLNVSGCIVTIDAMGCQQDITEAITDAGADYVLALKGNQGELRADVEAIFGGLRESEAFERARASERAGTSPDLPAQASREDTTGSKRGAVGRSTSRGRAWWTGTAGASSIPSAWSSMSDSKMERQPPSGATTSVVLPLTLRRS